MKKAGLMSAACAFSIISFDVSAITLVEDFEDPFPAWESDWLGLNSNIQNYLAPSNGGNFLWIDDGDGIRGAGETVEINFKPSFGSSLTSLSIDIDTYVDTSIQVYSGSGDILLDFTLDTTLDYEKLSIFSSSGISGFSLFSASQIEGNTAIDNVVASTVVPVPAALWLFGSGLIGLIGLTRQKAQ